MVPSEGLIWTNELAAVWGDEQIERPVGGACAIRLDRIVAGEGILTNNLPVNVR